MSDIPSDITVNKPVLCSGSSACVFLTGVGLSQTPLYKQHRYLQGRWRTTNSDSSTALTARLRTRPSVAGKKSLIKENEAGFLIHFQLNPFRVVTSSGWEFMYTAKWSQSGWDVQTRWARTECFLLNSVHGLKIWQPKQTHSFNTSAACYFALCICVYYAYCGY